MTEEYIERRRAYVADVRNSFDTDDKEKTSYESENKGSSFLFAKIQLLTAVIIFCLFLFLKLTGTEIYGYASEDVVDMITDNRYDKLLEQFLQEPIPIEQDFNGADSNRTDFNE